MRVSIRLSPPPNTKNIKKYNAPLFITGKESFYHWDDTSVSDIESRKVYMANHSPSDPHAALPHLQLHPKDSKVIRIYWPNQFAGQK